MKTCKDDKTVAVTNTALALWKYFPVNYTQFTKYWFCVKVSDELESLWMPIGNCIARWKGISETGWAGEFRHIALASFAFHITDTRGSGVSVFAVVSSHSVFLQVRSHPDVLSGAKCLTWINVATKLVSGFMTQLWGFLFVVYNIKLSVCESVI